MSLVLVIVEFDNIIPFNESYSVVAFFLMTIKPRLENDECRLQDARVGQAAHLLILVDINLPLMAITPTFGRFLLKSLSILMSLRM